MTRRRRVRRQGPVLAARYLRKSSRGQVHSLDTQAAVIDAYAADRGYQVVATYSEAVSGVRTRARAAFRELMATVLGGQATFQVILVYDITRWGRFQDPDEAGHYEFLCAQEGVRVEYCAEQFGLKDSVAEALLKGLKRALAAQTSRDLGVKVRHAQRRLASLGCWQHGPPGYGLRRQLVDAHGAALTVLHHGDRKALRNGVVRLVQGPATEVAVVRWIHARFTSGGLTIQAIADELNRTRTLAEGGAPWTFARVRQVLTNPKYMGDLVTQKRTTPLDGETRLRPCEEWITALNAVPAILSAKTYRATQAALAERAAPADDVLLARLAEIAQTHGFLGERRLRALGVRHWRSYRQRFGSLRQALAMVGCFPPERRPRSKTATRTCPRLSDHEMLCRLAQLALKHDRLTGRQINAAPDVPYAATYRSRFGSLAAAYRRIGFVQLSAKELQSSVGQARRAARDARLRHWAANLPSPPPPESTC